MAQHEKTAFEQAEQVAALYMKGDAISLCGEEVRRHSSYFSWKDRLFLTPLEIVYFMNIHELKPDAKVSF